MQRIGLIGILACAWLIALAAAPGGQSAAIAQPAPQQRSVKIYTDGIARPEGRASRAFTEMARVLSRQQVLRALPVMGYGGVANVNDLLNSRGVEFAILNSDVFAHLDIIKAHPEAKQKIRYVTRLFEQKAYLLAKREIASLDQLAGKTLAVLGPESSTEITARVVLQLSGVKADVQRVQGEAPPDRADALFFLGDDRADIPAGLLASGAFHLIPIPLNDKMAAIYRPVAVEPGEVPGMSGEPVPSIAVDTVIATYDWADAHPRHADVSRFIELFFAALPKLREAFPDSIWQETDVHATVAGWKRFAYAEKAKSAVPPVLPVAASAQGSAPPTPQRQNAGEAPPGAATEDVAVAAAPPEAVQAGGEQPLQLSVVPTPPLTDRTQQAGGLIAELAMAALSRAGAEVSLGWTQDRMEQIRAVVGKDAMRLAAPWETPNCDSPQNLSSEHAAICDGALVSEALFQVPVVFFTKADSDFDFTADDSVHGRVLCLHAGRDLTDLNRDGRNWAAEEKVTLKRPATLIDCLSMVERGEADALVGNEAESRFAIGRLGLSESFRMAERPLATRGIHIIVTKNRPGAEALLQKLNEAIAELKKSGDYSAIIARHLPAFMPHAVAKVQ